ncbi:GAF domain-containing protein [Tenacibaculum finnmarkense]|uniref:GAF domain-containing protein n=1 Tax=Tenacibaculum finnmarkense TaxID=2781243 RepID=UPI001EFB29F6|nr:GAF domain-containing protein [Tenacibaculum finnmarkense]MCG8892505.1 GAF domain-containing protein [Tenacibaculum finnmarkense]MCG8900597.1 GAF domain-containing protein [Tenacibaculum finnmarkense]
MEIRKIAAFKDIDLPLQLNISFEKIYDRLKIYANDTEHPFNASARVIIAKVNKYPELINGFSDLCLLDKHEDIIAVLLEALFPEMLTLNEIKAATIPFSFTSFKFTKRLKNILENAGEDYVLKVRDFENDKMYIMACTFILNMVYNYPIDLKRPFYFDIPDKKLDIIKHYRVAFNADFMEITPSENAPKITEEDIKTLLNNYDNIAIWKEKFPLNSYIFKGFGIMNLFDVTADENISSIRTTLLQKDDGNIIQKLRKDLSELFNIKGLKVGFSVFNSTSLSLQSTHIKRSKSLILLKGEKKIDCTTFFCNHIITKVFKEQKIVAISDAQHYRSASNDNDFSQRLKNKNIGSILLIPIKASANNNLALLEITAPKAYELNSVNQQKLQDIIPVFKAAINRSSEEFLNVLEATIQEHYTALHETVKWKFYEAAEQYQADIYLEKEAVKIEQIVFKDVYPLYGQSDIKGSSSARNNAIKDDLTTQLTLAISVLKQACASEKMPIYNELMFRVNGYLKEVVTGLKSGDEIGILDFLKLEIYPVFKHIKEINNNLKTIVNTYMTRLDSNLHVVYEKRKAYEQSVTLLNDKLATFIDCKQEEAQAMFPHYFERYKTDGLEYNMYIGQSLTKAKKFDEVYLYNLRLWQLQIMCEMENVANTARKFMTHDLQVASLILVHSTPLSIKFRMDEKQFDVDGAYNIRYEIIKKRIDKIHLKNTKERLTIPGKIAIVYSQDKDAKEYSKYIKYLQSKNLLGKVEMLELEDLQGVSGLKALRVSVIYQSDFDVKKTITIDALMSEFKS